MKTKNLSDKRSKKAQITIFMIIGILLVVTAGLVYYMIGSKEPISTAQQEISVQQVPNQVKPVKDYVERCVKDISKEAILKLGRHGGYIDPWDPKYAPSFRSDPTQPYESDGLQLSSDKKSFIPYYWYLESKTDCTNCVMTNRKIPRPEEVEKQLNIYVQDHLEECLDGFTSFEAQGFQISPKGKITAETVLTQNDVAIKVTYPLDVTLGGTTSEVREYLVRQPVKLKQIMRLARNIALGENRLTFLEKSLVNMIELYSGAGTDKLPPFRLTEQSFAKRIWIKTVTEQRVKGLLKTYTPMFRLNKTGTTPYTNLSPVENAAYNSMLLNIPAEMQNFSVDFVYNDWPIYFDVQPSEGEILTAYDTMKQNLLMAAPIKIQKYRFLYDVSWPVLVHIRGNSDFFDEGYSFMFAIEGNIKENKDLRRYLEGQGSIGSYRPLIKMAMDDSLLNDPRYENLTEQLSGPPQATLFCSEKQKIGSNLILNITSTEMTGDTAELSQARISFGCGLHASCSLGVPTLDAQTNSTVLKAKLPICMNGGYLKIEAPGHKTKYIPKLTSSLNGTINTTTELRKLYKVNATFKKLPFTRNILYRDPVSDYKGKYVTKLVPGEQKTELDSGDMVILRMQRQKDADELFADISKIAIVDLQNNLTNVELELSPGQYFISANLFDKTETIIAPENRCYHRTPLDKCDAPATVPDTPFKMDMYVSGGLEINENTGALTITQQDLKGKTKLEVPLIQIPRPMIIEDLEETSLIENLTIENIDLLVPSLS